MIDLCSYPFCPLFLLIINYNYGKNAQVYFRRRKGETCFPELRLKIRPVKGRAVIFDNLGADQENIKALLSELGLGKLDSLEAAKQRIMEKKELFGRVNAALNQFISKFSMPGSSVTPYIHGIIYNHPGLETIGVCDKGYIGLHIDNGHAFKVDQLSAAPNRMCINVGREDWHLLFIPRTSGEILRSLQTTMDIDTARYKEYQLTRDFLSANPGCPVLKMKQKPYEAYIAPTDNIIHDGCTVGMKEMDVSLVLIGEFGAWQTELAQH